MNSVSISLATYNGEEYLRPLLNSILDQSHRPDEIVACDDGSKDETINILSEYRESSSIPFHIYENDSNLGVEKNFEKCLKKSTGDLIAIADQDDLWKPNKLEEQIKAYEYSNRGLICHDSRPVSADLSKEYQTLWESGNHNVINKGSEETFKELLRRNFVQGTTLLLTREFVSWALPIPDYGYYDYFLGLLAAATGELHEIDKDLLLYRQHQDQEVGVRMGIISQIKTGISRGVVDPELSIERCKELSKMLHIVIDRLTNTSYVDGSREKIYSELRSRIEYEKNRMKTYDPSHPLSRYIYKNSSNGYYEEYGMGRLTLMKDLFAGGYSKVARY